MRSWIFSFLYAVLIATCVWLGTQFAENNWAIFFTILGAAVVFGIINGIDQALEEKE